VVIAWLLLAGAILSEVAATVALRAASTGSRAWYALTAVGYLLSFSLLSLVLREGVGVGVVYGIWTAAGVALTAVASRVIFKEPFSWVMAAGTLLVMGGVVLVELGSGH